MYGGWEKSTRPTTMQLLTLHCTTCNIKAYPSWLIDWLIDWLTDWPIDWLIYLLYSLFHMLLLWLSPENHWQPVQQNVFIWHSLFLWNVYDTLSYSALSRDSTEELIIFTIFAWKICFQHYLFGVYKIIFSEYKICFACTIYASLKMKIMRVTKNVEVLIIQYYLKAVHNIQK